MSNIITITNPTFTTGIPVTSDGKFLVTKLNHLLVGLPLYKFEWSFPEMDLLPATDINIGNGTFVYNATSYAVSGGGVLNPADGARVCVALTTGADVVGGVGAFAVPVFKIDNSAITDVLNVGLEFEDSTLVSDVVSHDYYVVSVNNERYGIPAYNYSSVYPFSTVTSQSAIPVYTKINISPTLNSVTPQEFTAGSTTLNSKIKNYADVIRRTKIQLGYPVVEVELCDELIIEYIDIAVEWYTKYAGFTEEFIVFDSTKYPYGRGYDMEKMFQEVYKSHVTRDHTLSGEFIDYDMGCMRKVINVWSFDQAEFTGTDALFTLEYMYAQQVYYSYMLGSYGFDLVTWETLKQFLDTRKRMFSSTPRVLFDPMTQRVRFIPEPDRHMPYIGILGTYVERPIRDIIVQRWVHQYTLALSKIALGHIRGKYSNVNLFGGGSIQGGDLMSQGIAERDKLEEEILKGYGEAPPPLMFVG